MNPIAYIMQWARGKGYGAMYGNPAHINMMMSDVDYLQCTDNTAVFCHLITASETANGGHDRETVGVFFSRLCDFDFDPEGLLSVQDGLKAIGKSLLNDINAGNVLGYEEPVRWQYGYDDYADNVAWVCMRVTLESLAAECVPMPATPCGLVNVAHELYDFFTRLAGGIEGIELIDDDFLKISTSISIGVVSNNAGAVVSIKIDDSEWVDCETSEDLITDDFVADVSELSEYIGKILITSSEEIEQGTHTVTCRVVCGDETMTLGPHEIEI